MKLTKKQIEFLNKVCGGREHWTLNENGEVDVKGSVRMNITNLTEIPVKFGYVDGWFNCSNNNLTTLKNLPNEIPVNWIINFYNNPLTEYFKNLKEEDFPHWKNLKWSSVLKEYPFLINIGKKYFNSNMLKYYLNEFPLTKLYLKD